MAQNTGKIVYFVRHGQSVDNVSDVFQGPDSPLSAAGREQAAKIARRLVKIPFDALIVSMMVRAGQTAHYITKATGNEPVYSNLFIERLKPSSVAGMPYTDQVADAKWKAWERTLFTPGKKRIEDGENYDMLNRRADAALAYLLARKEKRIAVVTHGYFLRVILLRAIFGNTLTPEAFRLFQARASMQNTGITVLRYEDTWDGPAWRLWTYNDHAHLG